MAPMAISGAGSSLDELSSLADELPAEELLLSSSFPMPFIASNSGMGLSASCKNKL
jgi:hypothetical protein